MVGTLQQVIDDMKSGVYDFTDNGKCIGCGQCCSNMLPISRKELKDLKRYIRKHNIKPQNHFAPTAMPSFDLTCPFRDDKLKICTVYEVRPEICRQFKCDNAKNGIWPEKEKFHQRFHVVNLREEIWG